MPSEALVYMRRGHKAHLVTVDNYGQPLSKDTPCRRCGSRPRVWESWLGTGDPVEAEIAGEMELCQVSIRSSR